MSPGWRAAPSSSESRSSACSSVVALRHAAEEGDAADGVELARGRAFGEPVRHLDDRALGVAVDQQVALGVGEDRAAHLVGPVVVMGDAAQRGLDAAEHDRHVLVGLAAALRVDDGAAVRPRAALAAGRVGVVAAQPAVRRVAVDHRVEIAPGDAEEQGLGLPSALKGSADCQSGCAMMPTRNPWASSSRPMIAMPKLGWST